VIRPDSYVGHLVAGADPGDIDDWVERWHTSDTGMELHEFLGMTFEEYGNWVLAPAAIEHIVAVRRMVDAARIEMTAAVARERGTN